MKIGALFLALTLTLSDQPGSRREFFTFEELVRLSSPESLPPQLDLKLARVLETPIVDNEASRLGAKPHRPVVSRLGPILRAAQWNIERGLQFDMIRLALSDSQEFLRLVQHEGSGMEGIESQLDRLQHSDVLILNEVDLGMRRTEYRDVARDVARSLNMNYAFGVEFVEVDPLTLGIEKIELTDPEDAADLRLGFAVDRDRYRGLHGNAILSRYPIGNVRIVRLPVCHDWFQGELDDISHIEKGKRLTLEQVFVERIHRQVRRGGRMALVADLAVPDVPTGKVTVVSAHLENQTRPRCRVTQINALLAAIHDVSNPVILAGDLNTTGADGTPTSVQHELKKRVGDYQFWATHAIKWLSPVGIPFIAFTPVRYFRTLLDPTVRNIPLVSRNREANLFRNLEEFRFKDRGAFDFRGNEDRTLRGREKTLANSNQRSGKGFKPTFAMEKTYAGLVGRYKLDWILIKPFITDPRDEGLSYRFAPHYPNTMNEVNEAVPDRLADHAPITVDLPLFNPAAVR